MAAAGIVLAGLGYLVLKPKADIPATVEQTTPAPIKEAKVEPAPASEAAQPSAPITTNETTQPTVAEVEEKPRSHAGRSNHTREPF